MKRSLLNTAIRNIQSTARMLIALQSRAEGLGTAYLDPREFSDHMQRDLGLLDGQRLRLERQRRTDRQASDEGGALTGLFVTPHAS
ncbi:hypothetical protein [Mesorhizobium sp. CN2-181]|uniref:hypothetical protein n=1 Tax=Mesorhizobium yinganensis TaxID=3157707 RepID=UPI0032B7B6D7